MSQQDWGDPENWVWEQIRIGKIADFHTHLGPLDPKNADGWKVDRQVSSAFLRQIFCDKELHEEMPPEGARIIGAWFRDGLLLPDGRLPGSIWLDHCRFEKPIDLSNQVVDGSLSFERSFVAAPPEDMPAIDFFDTKIDGWLNLSGATVTGLLIMNGLQVGRHLLMVGSKEAPATFAAVDLTGAKIGGQLNLSGASVGDTLQMGDLQVGQSLVMVGSKEAPATFAAVDLTGAKIGGQLNLSGASVGDTLQMGDLQVGQSLVMVGSKEAPATFAAVDLTSAKIDGWLDLSGATVTDMLTMNRLQVGQYLLMVGSKEAPATFAAINLSDTKIDGWLNLSGATITGLLSSEEAPATFAAVDLTDAKINGWLDLSGASVGDTLQMGDLQVGRHLVMVGSKEAPATFAAVDLTSAKIDGWLDLSGATVTDMLTMNRLQVGQGLNLSGATITGLLIMNELQVGQYLLMVGSKEAPATFAAVDLTRAKIDGWLDLSGATVTDMLTMNDTHASVLHDIDFVWPEQVGLDGFTYDRLSGGDGRRDSEWYIRWLAKDWTYSPQPYEQLAEVLLKRGEPEMAADVLYAERERARRASRGWLFIWMTLLNWTRGYALGARYFRLLWWIGLFTVLGMGMLIWDASVLPRGNWIAELLGSSAQFKEPDQVQASCLNGLVSELHKLGLIAGFVQSNRVQLDCFDSLAYSLQKLVPLVEFKKFDQVQLGPVAQYYFFFHQLFGYFITVYLVAGMSGLTQKSR